jgi:hypothetical protein
MERQNIMQGEHMEEKAIYFMEDRKQIVSL